MRYKNIDDRILRYTPARDSDRGPMKKAPPRNLWTLLSAWLSALCSLGVRAQGGSPGCGAMCGAVGGEKFMT